LYQEQKAAAANRAQLARLQHEKDEFQRMVISTQQVRIQQMHELKKKEKDFIKLQERLNQVLLERKKEVKNSMDMLSSLQACTCLL
jgi:X breakpoint 2-interacting protein